MIESLFTSLSERVYGKDFYSTASMKSERDAAWEVLEAYLTYVFMNQSFLCYSGPLSTYDETHKEHAC